MKYPEDCIREALESIENQGLKRKIVGLYEKHSERMKKAPASKSKHHNWRGGLHDHNYEVISIALHLFHSYKDKLPAISRDDVIVCALLHDFEKLDIYDWNDEENAPFKKEIKTPEKGLEIPFLGSEIPSQKTNLVARKVAYIQEMIKEFHWLTPIQIHALALSEGGYSGVEGEQTNLSVIISAADSISTLCFDTYFRYKESNGKKSRYNRLY